MTKLITLEANKTYATRENAIKAVTKFMEGKDQKAYENQTYFIQVTANGRFFPVFVGERAVHALLHFHFNVVA